MRITVDHLWDGSPATPTERVSLELSAADDVGSLRIAVEAPYHGDPPPVGRAGSTPGLWNHEVVELFVFGDDGHYLEIELGPHGHHLVLQLHGIREVTRQVPWIAYHCEIDGARWRGEARVRGALVPDGAARWNAHAIHGVGDARRYLSALPAGGARPDFHRPEVSAPIDPSLREALHLTRPTIRFTGQRIPLDATTVHAVDTRIDADALSRLADLHGLRRLSLNTTDTTDASLAIVGRLHTLEFLDLACTDITDAGLAHLGGLTALEHLILKDNDLTAAALPHLAPLTRLKTLHLGSMQLDDHALSRLGAFSKLSLLILSGPGFGCEALLALQRQLPGCSIVVRDAAFPLPPEFE